MGRKKLEGVLQASGTDQFGKITILVKENEAHKLFQHDAWEILPYLKHLQFAVIKKESSHEIRY
jgi:hemolysin-activating ACP:hemolysin acyltransferase